jgi:hypothetical protein
VVSLGPWSIDVAYFMVGSLSIVDRQHHEDALLRHYLDVAGGYGAPDPHSMRAWPRSAATTCTA